MGALLTHSTMERAWFVWPGDGRETLRFDDEGRAIAARDAINRGESIGRQTAKPLAPIDRSAFFPSRSSKVDSLLPQGSFAPSPWGSEIGKRRAAPARPEPKPELRRIPSGQSSAAPSPAMRPSPAPFSITAATAIYRKTGSLIETGAAFGRSKTSMREYLKAAGVALNPARKPTGKKERPRVAVDIERAVALHDNGKGLAINAVAKALGTTWATLTKRLKEAGITLQKRNGGLPIIELDIERAKAIYARTSSLNQTAEALGVSPATAKRKLKDAGVTILSSGAARAAQLARLNAPRRVIWHQLADGNWSFVTDDPLIEVIAVDERRNGLVYSLAASVRRVAQADVDALLGDGGA